MKLLYLVGAFLALYVTALTVSADGWPLAGNYLAGLVAMLGLALVWWANKDLSRRFPEDRVRSWHTAVVLYAILGATAVYHLASAMIGSVNSLTVFAPAAVLLLGMGVYASLGAHDH